MKKFKTIALILSMLILLQGCTVYKSASVSLEQAALVQTKVKLETKSGEKLKFIRIGVENGNYYGVKKVKGNIVKVPLETNYIKSVKLKDKFQSDAAGAIILIFILAWSMSGMKNN